MTFQNIWLQSLWIDDLHGDLPPLLASLLMYVIAFTISFILYHISTLLIPKPFQLYSADFFKTLVICTYPYGHGLIREHHGNIGYCLAAVPVVVFTVRMFSKGCASPLGVFKEFLNKKHSLLVMLVRIGVQIVAGFASYRLASVVWLLQMHPSHVMKLSGEECSTDLNVPVITGFLVEMGAVMFDTLLSFVTLSKHAVVDTTFKVFNGALMVCAGVHMTGMYMHPVMASGISFWCHGTSTLEHIFVYWVGSFLGCYVAVVIYRLVSSTGKRKRKDSRDVRNSNHSDEKIKINVTDNNRNKIIQENGNYFNMHNTTRLRRA